MSRLTEGALAIGLVMGLTGLLVGVAVLLARTEGAQQIVEDATVQHRAEAVLGGAAVTRSAIDQAVLFAGAREVGAAPQASLDQALAHLRSSLGELDRRTRALGRALGEPSDLDELGPRLVQAGWAVVEAVEAGDLEEGRRLARSEFDPAYDGLVSQVAAERDRRERHIAAVREGVGRVATAARFMVALVIPAAVIFAVHRTLRRRQERVLLEAELATERELRREKDTFVAAVSHELRTPLSAVVGFAEVLREGRHDFNAGERNEMIELVADQARETSHILDDLLVAARADLGELTLESEEVDLRSVVERVTEGWGRTERARLTIRGGGVATGDPERIRQILRNLLQNALEHGRESLEVVISDGIPTVTVEVVDDGEGIPPEERDRIFRPYQRAYIRSGQPASLGLGLSVSRLLARRMGGDLAYRRRADESVFELSLPAADRASVPDARPDRVIDPTEGRPTEAAIRRLLAEGGPDIVFQPIVDLRTGDDRPLRVIGYEALARFPYAAPPEWFGTAEGAGLRLELELACIRAAIEEFAVDGEAFLTLNVSDDTLTSSRLSEALAGIEPDRVILELSEEAAIRSYEATREALVGLTSLGYRLALDDVGSAEMDLWHVLRLQPAMVKLDISLTRDLDENYDNRALVHGVGVFTADLGAMVVAEGVERESEVHALLQLGVHLGQGYLLGRPAPLEEGRKAAAVGRED